MWISRYFFACALAAAVSGCASDDAAGGSDRTAAMPDDGAAPNDDGAAPNEGGPGAAETDDAGDAAQAENEAGGGEPQAPEPSGNALSGSCPDGFVPTEGLNTDFASGGDMRQFHVFPAAGQDGPRPLFVSLTGTVQEEVAFAEQSELRGLTESGWIVVSPVRSCSQAGSNCSMTGSDGRVWEPWYDGTLPPSDDAGPDVEFVEAMIRCVASMWPVAADQIYAGGISAGGSFTNRNMTFNSSLFAGGVPASGNWTYGVYPASAMQMERSIVVIIWGGPDDTWPGSPPYSEETQAAAAYYAEQENVVTVACTGSHGHRWPEAMTPWLAETLLSHPKGSDPAAFTLTEPPDGFSCVLGPYPDP